MITTVEGTLAADVARTLFDKATLKVFPTPEAAEKLLLANEAAAHVAAMPEVRFLALQHPDRVDLPIEKPMLASVEGLAVRQANRSC